MLGTIVTCSLAFLSYVVIKYGVQPSISASVYKLGTEVKKSFYAWFIFCISLPMMIVAENWMGFVAGSFLMLDAVNPAGGEEKLQDTLHVIGANEGMAFGVAMLGFMWGQWWLVGSTVATVLATYLLSKKKKGWVLKNETWWIECEVLAAVLLGLIIEKL